MSTAPRLNTFLATVIGLVAMALLVSCGTLQPSVGESQPRQTENPTAVLMRKFEPPYETNISLPQYRQADEYMRVEAPSEIGVPVRLSTRYAQTEHMPIFEETEDGNQSTSRAVNWGFISFAADFDKHVRIVEGRLANPAKAGDPYIEAVMMTEKLDALGAKVGDHLVLAYRTPGGEVQPIEVKVVGSWVPLNSKELYWFYDPSYFSEGLMVPEETYMDVILPGWREIGYEYTWFAVYDVGESDTDDFNTGVDYVRTSLTTIIGPVKVDVLSADLLTSGRERNGS